MQIIIRVKPEPPGLFTAHAVGIPELRMTALTKQLAIDAVRALLSELLAAGELAAIDLNVPVTPMTLTALVPPHHDETTASGSRMRSGEFHKAFAAQEPPATPLAPPPPPPQRPMSNTNLPPLKAAPRTNLPDITWEDD
jgi:hypothetical protein